MANKIVKFATDQSVGPNGTVTWPSYTDVQGFNFVNITVKFSQASGTEPPLDLSVMFAYDVNGTMSSSQYVNFEENQTNGARDVGPLSASGLGTWHGSPHNVGSYTMRIPVMGPFMVVVAANRAPVARKFSVWGYLLA